MDWSIEQVVKLVIGSLTKPAPERNISGLSIDSRTLEQDELFVAIRGENADGHFYLSQAFERGASGALVQDIPAEVDSSCVNLIQVPDTIQALHALAKSYRQNFDIPIIGITGSSGKTTTKELLYTILSKKCKCYRSPGNFNTEIGAPLALLGMPESTEIGIFELGLQNPGDIEILCKLIEPKLGLITNISTAHLGYFDSQEQIGEEKWKLAETLPPDGKLFINFDDEFLSSKAKNFENSKVIGYGLKSSGTLTRISQIDQTNLNGLTMKLETPEGSQLIASNLLGKGNVYAIAAATCVAQNLEVPSNQIAEAIAAFKPVPQRMELKRSASFGLIIDDTYNANPGSMKSAIQSLALYETDRRKSLILGDMLELGERSEELHRALAAEIAGTDIELVLTFGEETRTLRDELAQQVNVIVKHASTYQELSELCDAEISGDQNLILIKGSRSMKLERIVDFLLN